MTAGIPWPLAEEQVLAWARGATWAFESYYKYSFTFTASGTLIAPDACEGPREFRATASTGGDAPDIYRFSVGALMTWDDLRDCGIPDLIIRDSSGEELMRINGSD